MRLPAIPVRRSRRRKFSSALRMILIWPPTWKRNRVWSDRPRIGQLGPGFQADPQLYEIPVSAPEHLHVMVSHMQSLDAVEIASLNPTGSFATVPNDPQLGSQWGLQAINAPAAWDIRSDSSDVIVAIADTGVTAHPDLTDNLWINLGEIPDNGIDDDGNGYTDDLLGWDGVFNSPDVSDFAAAGYHGTSVSGVAGASGNNARGVSGVSWDASLMTIRGTFSVNGFGALTTPFRMARRSSITVGDSNSSQPVCGHCLNEQSRRES